MWKKPQLLGKGGKRWSSVACSNIWLNCNISSCFSSTREVRSCWQHKHTKKYCLYQNNKVWLRVWVYYDNWTQISFFQDLSPVLSKSLPTFVCQWSICMPLVVPVEYLLYPARIEHSHSGLLKIRELLFSYPRASLSASMALFESVWPESWHKSQKSKEKGRGEGIGLGSATCQYCHFNFGRPSCNPLSVVLIERTSQDLPLAHIHSVV